MRSYPSYRHSDIGWICDIPDGWKVMKLKYLVDGKLMYGANEVAEQENLDDPRYIRITDFEDSGSLRENTFKSLPFEKAKDYLLSEGDILFARSGATVGKTFQFKNYQGLACFAGYLIKASPDVKKMISDFLSFYTKSATYENWKNSVFNQATIQNIGADKYNELLVPVPDIAEQRTISRFLTQKVSDIDNLVSQRLRLIELLQEEKTAVINEAVTKGLNPDVKMKDSGIPWLEEIPEHWDIKKLKYLCSVITKGTTPSTEGKEFTSCGIRFIKAENIAEGIVTTNPEFYIDEDTNEKLCRSKLQENDILIVIAGATIGKTAILGKNMLPANTNQAVCLIRLSNKMLASFVRLVLSSTYIQNIIKLSSVQAAQPNLSMEVLGNFSFPIPSLSEIDIITTYIFKEISRINEIEQKVKTEINLLSEYRTSLISEAVTGKIDVRDININEQL